VKPEASQALRPGPPAVVGPVAQAAGLMPAAPGSHTPLQLSLEHM
jgi:hypothetical protein